MTKYTISSLISYCFSKISNHDDTSRYDIQMLVCDVLGVDRGYLFTYPEYELSNHQTNDIMTRIDRLAVDEPLAYILGYKHFWEQKLFVTKDTLIPRADTEIIIESILCDYTDKTAQLNILDLGTGTGAIALALASEYVNAKVLAVDFSAKAIEVACKNAKQNNISNVDFVVSDWFSRVPKQSFDIIVSNPPYIDNSDNDIDAEVRKYEPSTALFALQNGLADIIKIAANAKHYMSNGAHLYIEHGHTQATEVADIFQANDLKDIVTVKDYSNKDRCTKACKIN